MPINPCAVPGLLFDFVPGTLNPSSSTSILCKSMRCRGLFTLSALGGRDTSLFIPEIRCIDVFRSSAGETNVRRGAGEEGAGAGKSKEGASASRHVDHFRNMRRVGQDHERLYEDTPSSLTGADNP